MIKFSQYRCVECAPQHVNQVRPEMHWFQQFTETPQQIKKVNSLYASANFAYDNFAYLDVTARNDWFSTLSLAGKDSPNNDLYTSATLSLILSDALD